jgi:hypothetical protein
MLRRIEMRHLLAFGMAWLAGVASASAQVSERLELAAVMRTDRVSFEGNQHAQLPVTGAAIAYRVWRDMRIEGEVTTASGESRRSYEGDFISYAGPGASREEFLRMAVIARRTTVNRPGPGFATAVAVETRDPRRVNLGLRAGVSFRQYSYVEDMTILRVPEGITVERAEASLPDGAGQRGRGGILLGLSVPVRLVSRLHVVPEARWVWGGPARVGHNYDEATAGARVVWKF